MQKIFSYKDIVATLVAEFDLVKVYSNMVIMLKVLWSMNNYQTCQVLL